MAKNNYLNYDYQSEYDEVLEKDAFNEVFIQSVLQHTIKSVYATKEILSGSQLEIDIYPQFKRHDMANLKKIKKNKIAQDNLNDKNARKRVERLINCNFGKGDLWLTFTYSPGQEPKNMDEAKKNFRNYIARLKYERKKRGLPPPKYIYITEYSPESQVRWHHHCVMDAALDRDTIENKWKHGKRNQIRKIEPDENGLTGLARYITKEKKKSDKRWCSSKGLKKPKEKVNHYKFKRRKVVEMVMNQQIIPKLMEDTYKQYQYVEAEVRHNNFNGYWYISARMRRRN